MLEKASIRCPWRVQPDGKDNSDVAVCRLLEKLSGTEDQSLCTVREDACLACCASYMPFLDDLNPVVASLLFQLAGRVLEQGGTRGCSADKAAHLQLWAEPRLLWGDYHVTWAVSRPEVPARTPMADVVLCCTDSSEATARSVDSVLNQEGAEVFLHLLATEPAKGLQQRYGDHPNVICHVSHETTNVFDAIHELVPCLRSDFVAVQDARAISHPGRIRGALEQLRHSGADLFGAAVERGGNAILPEEPGSCFRRYIAPETLVLRRAAWRTRGASRTALSVKTRNLFIASTWRSAKSFWLETRPLYPPRLGARDRSARRRYSPRDGRLAHHARGFPEESIACDVVLPFHGQLDYVAQAIRSVLDQQGAEVVLHLIDDASSEETDSLLRFWASHSRVRTYRNVKNIGQFATFNNIVPFLETRLVAVQDGDDLSQPRRIRRAGNALRLADADIFGGRILCFSKDDPLTRAPDFPWAQPRYHPSRYPDGHGRYFLQNPSAVMRVGAFETLGGFADFGPLLRNRCGLDTEFYMRAYHSGSRFALLNDIVTYYRVHPESALQHPLTRWGSPARTWSEREVRRRASLFKRGPFDARAFGSLRAHWGETARLRY